MAASASSSPTSATEAVEAARKRKHRELVKRQYYQKLEVLKELRQQQDVLKAQHSALLRSRPPVVTFGGPTASVQILHDMYVEATREKERQMKENTVLRHIHNQYLSFHKNLATASAAEKRERQAEAGPKEATKEPESESDSPSENQRLELKLITADACYEVIRAAYAEFGGEMKHFSADNAKFWMMEVLLMGLRWESRTVAPLITLQR
eukprot:jgi/Phyca11/18975/fgenesh1_pg.PHYCAscaffold_42_\